METNQKIEDKKLDSNNIFVKNILSALNKWLIPQVIWKNDPVGLLVGNIDAKVSRILLVLNVTPEIVEEAVALSCDLIVSHHPLFKKPMNKIVKGEYYSDIVLNLIKNNINLISCHTNFDLVKNGVSKLLADRFNLQNQIPMVPLSKIHGIELIENYKIAVYVPSKDVSMIKKKISDNGGATIDDYDFCFFETEGKGSFRGNENSNPTIGEKNKIEEVDEIKLETIVPSWNLKKVLVTIKENHPYEEPAIDIFKICNESDNFGLGIVGNLDKDLKLEEFIRLAKKRLNSDSLRIVVKDRNKIIKRVAVCGGSGSSFWKDALNHKADIYISSEFNHHSYLEAKEHINVIDATHHTTEKFVMKGFYNYLKDFVDNKKLIISKKDIDPVEMF